VKNKIERLIPGDISFGQILVIKDNLFAFVYQLLTKPIKKIIAMGQGSKIL